MSIFIISLLAAIGCYATTITVCASGCTTTSYQTALNNAVRGDIIELRAGETFEGSFRLPYKGAGSGMILTRTSRYLELPPVGTRVTSAMTALMAKIQPSFNSVAAIYNVPEEMYTSSVNTTTDTVTTVGSHGFVDGEPVNTRFTGGTIPSPLAMGTTYFIRDAAATTFKLALTPGGSVVDLTGSATATLWRWQTQWVGSNYSFQGIEVAKKTGQDTLYNLFELGRGEEYVRAGIPSNFVIQHSYIHGVRDENGPTACLILNVRNFTVRDSAFSACIQPGGESKAISFAQAPGPGLIQNNLIEGASINLLVGGKLLNIYGGIVSGDEGQISIIGNYFNKPMWYRYTSGTSQVGAPVGACSDGAFSLRTSNGVMYKCASSVWGLAPTPAEGEYFRSTSVAQNCGAGACWSANGSGVFVSYGTLRQFGYGVKNLLEIKSGTNFVIDGNIFERSWPDAQDGYGVLLVSKVNEPGYNAIVDAYNIRFTNNILRNSSWGFRTATEGGVAFANTNRLITASNNLGYYIGVTQYPSIDDQRSRSMSFAGPCISCYFDHFTVSSATTGGSAMYFDTAPFTTPRMSNSAYYAKEYGNFADGGVPVSNYWGTGNLLNSVGVDNAATQGAPASMGAYATNGNWITPATALFTSSSNFRLLPTSPYSASCAVGCLYTATDGKDLGADVDIIDSATQGAVTGAPWLGGSIQVALGSTRAIVRYTAPDGASCNLKLYTNIGRSTLATDTDTAPEQADTRTGNVTNGTARQFVLGTSAALTPSTQYWGVVTCGTSVGYFAMKTLAAGSGTYNFVSKYASAVTGEYSSSADMSSPTSISSSTTHAVPVPTGAVRYYRYTGGLVQAFVAR